MSIDYSPYVPDVTFELIPIKHLVSNQKYQRRLSESQIIRAAQDSDVCQINAVKVSRRDGINYVFDGQHTIEIVAAVSGSRDTPVWCMVFDSLYYEAEAKIFAEQQKHSRPLVPTKRLSLTWKLVIRPIKRSMQWFSLMALNSLQTISDTVSFVQSEP